MTDTTTLAPTDAEILDAAKSAGFYFHDAGYAPTLHTTPHQYSQKCFERFARAVLAKWGAPAPASDALEKAVRKLHAARGRHHNQIAACDLYDLLGLPNVRPGQEAEPPAQEVRVPLSSRECRDMLEEVDPYNFAIDLIRAVEKHHGITAQKEAP